MTRSEHYALTRDYVARTELTITADDTQAYHVDEKQVFFEVFDEEKQKREMRRKLLRTLHVELKNQLYTSLYANRYARNVKYADKTRAKDRVERICVHLFIDAKEEKRTLTQDKFATLLHKLRFSDKRIATMLNSF